MAKKRNMYVNNKTLYEHMKVYRKSYLDAMAKGEQRPPLPNYVGQCILLIAQRMATKRGFSGYSYVDEMISDAIENCCLYVHNFDPEKSKLPFAYISKIVKFAFIRRINEEQEEQYCMLKSSMNSLVSDQLNPNQVMGTSVSLYDNLEEFITDFERKKNIKNKKKVRKSEKVEPIEFWAA